MKPEKRVPVRPRVNPNFSNTDADLGIAARKAMPHTERPTNMRKKYFREEDVFRFIWNAADRGGIWDGDTSTVASEFNVSEAEAHEVLSVICDRGHIEKLVPGKYAIVNWRERDEPAEEESPS
jgi:predicted transcriptional regulator of viral defense system